MQELLFIVGLVLTFAGGIWLLLTIFMESVLWGLCSLLLPIFSLAFVAMRWDDAKAAFLTQVTGIVMIVASLQMGGAT